MIYGLFDRKVKLDMSILDSISKILGVSEAELEYFTPDLCWAINSVLMQAHAMGLIKDDYAISNNNTRWIDILKTPEQINLHALISWTALRVKLLFDPPTSATLTSTIEKEVARLEWYIYITENYVGEI